MSHFVTLVILPKDTELADAEAQVVRLLQPYDETIRVKPYDTQCWCVGVQARIEVEAEVARKWDINRLRDKFRRLPEEDKTDEKWAELLAPAKKMRQELLEAHPLKDSPNPDCETCEGTGTRTTEYNPASKWDWWVIGGRWDGWIYGPDRESLCRDKKDGGFNLGDQHQRLVNNCRRVSEIPVEDPHYVPFAILTPEGVWVQQGEMGWWAIVSNSMGDDQWQQTVKAVLSKYADHLAVAVDCHI